MFHMGTDGILMAEPVSNFIGGTACFVTMLCIGMAGTYKRGKG